MKLNFFISTLIFAALALAAISAIPSWRQSVRSFFSTEERQILAKIVTQLTSKEESFTLVKIKQKDELFVEVYKQSDPQAASSFIGKIELNDRKDAFFNFRGQATNMAVSDIDQDGIQEILIPTYDQDMTARLNIYKYDVKSNNFTRMNSFDNNGVETKEPVQQ